MPAPCSNKELHNITDFMQLTLTYYIPNLVKFKKLLKFAFFAIFGVCVETVAVVKIFSKLLIFMFTHSVAMIFVLIVKSQIRDNFGS